MLTVLLVCVLFLVAAFILSALAGLIAFSLPVLIIVGLILIDIMVMKWIFGRKKKEED